MPHLAGVIESGVFGNLASIRPLLSPMLWASIATGKRPHKHGIFGFVEPNPLTGGIRPTSSTTRTSKALWNILSQSGLKSNVVGWYASHPAEPIRGVFVSDAIAGDAPASGQAWPLPDGAVHPKELHSTLADLRVNPTEIDGASLLRFVPRAPEVDQQKDRRLHILINRLAQCASIHAVATAVMAEQPWDFMAVYYPTLDELSHTFMDCHPPRMAGLPEQLFELYKNVVSEAYCFMDMLLGRLLELAGDQTTVLICSDHGYHSDHLRPAWTPKIPAGPTIWHRSFGMIAGRGPTIKKDELLYGATILDLAPTILALLGLPIGNDMDGRVWTEIFDPPLEVARVPSWEDIAGEDGMHPPEARANPVDSGAALQQLIDLGYVQEPGTKAKESAEQAVRELEFNRACALIDANLPAEAALVLERLLANEPTHLFMALNLANCYQQTGRLGDARRLAEDIIARSQDESQPAFGRPPEPKRIAGTRRKGTEGPRLIPQADLLLGLLDLEEKKPKHALTHLLRAENAEGVSHHVLVAIGRAYLQMRRWPDAESALQKALKIDPDDPRALDGLSEACLGLKRNEEAAEHALDAVGLQHFLPSAHYHLGVALTRLGLYDRAITAFEHCRAMRRDRAPQAARWLRRLNRLKEQAPRAN